MSIKKPGAVPSVAGVYIFKRAGKPLYVGKAVNLKRRLASYFRKKISGKTALLLEEADKLEWIETHSEVMALLKEAELIKKYRPKWNYLLRDDKNYFYVGITQEAFPRIFVTHQPSQKENLKSKIDYIGPFTSGLALKKTLKLLRRIFPYCTCKKLHKRPCLNTQIGRCFGFCCLENEKLSTWGGKKRDEYEKSIKSIVTVLNGKRKVLLTGLKKRMREAARRDDFEEAARLRDQIKGLENIFEHQNLSLPQTPLFWNKIESILKNLLAFRGEISRVEGYDISNISGTEATGSMVVFLNGKPVKYEYRRFRIKTVSGANDTAMLKEVLRRRFSHTEWPLPDLILIDGGKPQLNAALLITRSRVKIIALAKREEKLYIKPGKNPIPLKNLPEHVANFLKLVRDESHRFAKKYHHKLREKLYRNYNIKARSL